MIEDIIAWTILGGAGLTLLLLAILPLFWKPMRGEDDQD